MNRLWARIVPVVLSASLVVLIASSRGAAPGVPSPALQAELVAQLHAYIGQYRKVKVGGLQDSDPAKEITVHGITLVGADQHFLSVKFAVKIREKHFGAVIYTLDGSATGRFNLGEVTAQKACIAAPSAPGGGFVLQVDSINIPRISGPDETEGARRAIRANFLQGFCVPLYPAITISNGSAEEQIVYPAKPGPVPNTMRFTVKLSNLSARTVSMRFATADGTAKAGTDYSAAAGTLSIPTLSPTGTISVSLRRRPGRQGDRTFTLNLSNPLNGTLANGQAKGLIIDYPDER